MDRRELLKFIAAATGCAFIGIDRAFAAASSSTFTAGDVALFDEVAETILPRTSTPGAKDAAVGKFIAIYSDACYEPSQLRILKSGIGSLNEHMRKKYGVDFMHAGKPQREAALIEIDRMAKELALASAQQNGEQTQHYFTLMKQLTLLGFFTSEAGMTRVARYRPIPGKYKGCVDYTKGEPFWS